MAEPITSGHLAALTSPAATPELVEHLAQTVLDRLAHDHPAEGKGEDFYCVNLTSYMGERMGPVLVRLREAEAEAAKLRAELETYKAPPDFHNADHLARVRQVVTDTIREFGTDPERTANGVMLSFEAAMHTAEREAARAMDLAEATLTSLETANAEVTRLRTELEDWHGREHRHEYVLTRPDATPGDGGPAHVTAEQADRAREYPERFTPWVRTISTSPWTRYEQRHAESGAPQLTPAPSGGCTCDSTGGHPNPLNGER